MPGTEGQNQTDGQGGKLIEQNPLGAEKLGHDLLHRETPQIDAIGQVRPGPQAQHPGLAGHEKDAGEQGQIKKVKIDQRMAKKSEEDPECQDDPSIDDEVALIESQSGADGKTGYEQGNLWTLIGEEQWHGEKGGQHRQGQPAPLEGAEQVQNQQPEIGRDFMRNGPEGTIHGTQGVVLKDTRQWEPNPKHQIPVDIFASLRVQKILPQREAGEQGPQDQGT